MDAPFDPFANFLHVQLGLTIPNAKCICSFLEPYITAGPRFFLVHKIQTDERYLVDEADAANWDILSTDTDTGKGYFVCYFYPNAPLGPAALQPCPQPLYFEDAGDFLDNEEAQQKIRQAAFAGHLPYNLMLHAGTPNLQMLGPCSANATA